MGRYAYKKAFPEWTPALAYVVGVIATDGNLSSDRRHITVTSKDIEMVAQIKKLLNLKCKVSKKARGYSTEKKYYALQFSDVCLYDFLLFIGLAPAKSKTIGPLLIPDKYFPDFIRGCIDGDGSIGGYTHPESKFMQYKVRLVSASPTFLKWMLETSRKKFLLSGGSIHPGKGVSCLTFGKGDARKILKSMYYNNSVPSLTRKLLVAQKFLGE